MITFATEHALYFRNEMATYGGKPIIDIRDAFSSVIRDSNVFSIKPYEGKLPETRRLRVGAWFAAQDK